MGWTTIATPWGEFSAAVEGDHLVELRFPGFPVERVGPPTPLHEKLAQQLEEYMRGQRTTFDLALRLRGTEFQVAVWREIARLPYGATVSYGELATRVERPRSARAVGQAVGANPVPIVVPCHRILPAGGGVGGFGPGPDWKRRLLALEGAGS